MLAGSTKNITLKVKYDGEAQSSEQTGTITLNFDFTRLKGGIGEVVEEVYPAYEIGDTVSFAGSNWYVIEDSRENQDYVTVLKETVLTSAELGEYATTSISNTMSYYWSSTCHSSGTYGYSDQVTTGCSGHNDYTGSKIKEFFEGTYISTIGETNLKAVDGYKIRLLNENDFEENLGYVNNNKTDNTPQWVYDKNIVKSGYYWTMIPRSNLSTQVYYHDEKGMLLQHFVYNKVITVRPVINLYKDAIDE